MRLVDWSERCSILQLLVSFVGKIGMLNKIVIILVWVAIGIAVIWVVGGMVLRGGPNGQNNSGIAPGALDAFAQCLSNTGAKMYGASWCPHCQNQKKLFGDSFSKIDYVECADPADPNKQAQACTDANITGYPTWIFADGQRIEGEAPFEKLSEKSGCAYNK